MNIQLIPGGSGSRPDPFSLECGSPRAEPLRPFPLRGTEEGCLCNGIRIFAVYLCLGVLSVFALTSVRAAERIVGVAEFGAVPDDGRDDSRAFQDALDALHQKGGGVLQVPAGRFDIAHQLVVFAPRERGGDAAVRIAIHGAGSDRTRLVGTDERGVLFFESKRNAMYLTLTGFSILAARPGIETAVSILNPELGVRVDRGFLLEGIRIAGAGDEDYFLCGVKTLGQWRPLIRNLEIEGARADGDGADGFRADIGIDLAGFYGGGVYHCRFAHLDVPVSIVTEGAGEGGTVLDSEIGPCRVGVEYFTPGQEPGGLVARCRIRATETGVLVDRRRLIMVVDNVIRALAPGFTDVEIRDSWAVTVQGNTFEGPSEGRTHVLVDGGGPPMDDRERSSNRSVRSREILIADNAFLVPADEAVQYRGELIFAVTVEDNEMKEAP